MAVRIFNANGPVHLEWFQKTASTEFSFNEPVALSTAGRLIPYTPGIVTPFQGLIKKTIATTDSDYASTTRVPVEVGNYDTEYLIDETQKVFSAAQKQNATNPASVTVVGYDEQNQEIF